MKTPLILIAGACILFLSGLGVGALLDKPAESPKTTASASELHKIGKLTSPLLECDIPNSVGGSEFGTFEKSLRDTLDSLTNQGKITLASVYFRHMMDGAWIGINETEKFTPASLLKVPNMIAILKEAETDPTILTKQFAYTKTYTEGTPYFLPDKSLELNKSYTVDDLLTYMVKYSDNEAMYLLRNSFDASLFNRLYTDLDIAVPDDNISDDFMTVKTYASFFRILFNASYLSIPMSEKALALLTETSFSKGLVAGVPKDVIVAHKFGERTYTDDNTKQLHDCGIVYAPNNPYLLCIMTRGDNFDTLADVIKTISSSVWNEVQKKNVGK